MVAKAVHESFNRVRRAAFLALILSLTAGCGEDKAEDPEPDMRLPVVAECELRQGPCTAVLPGGGLLEFGMEPRDLPVLERLSIKAAVTGIAASGVDVTVTGVNMDMGVQHSVLESLGDGQYRGQVILPVCMHPRMVWEAAVRISANDVNVVVPFEFYTERGSRDSDEGAS